MSHLGGDEISPLDFKLIAKWCDNSLIKCWHLLDIYLGWFYFLAWKHPFSLSNLFNYEERIYLLLISSSQKWCIKNCRPIIQCTGAFLLCPCCATIPDLNGPHILESQPYKTNWRFKIIFKAKVELEICQQCKCGWNWPWHFHKPFTPHRNNTCLIFQLRQRLFLK